MSAVLDLEQQLEEYKTLIAKREMALKLSENYEFKTLILDYFMKEECARYCQLSADPALDPANRADALAIAQAAGHLKRFLSVVIQMGAHAERTYSDLEQEIEAARAEDGEER